MSLLSQTGDIIRTIPKRRHLSVQIINITRSEQTTDCRLPFADNLRKTAMMGADRRFAELCRFENRHRKPLVTTAWNHQKASVLNKIRQFLTFQISHKTNILRRLYFAGHPPGPGESGLNLRMTPSHLNQQIISFLITQPPDIGNIIT